MRTYTPSIKRKKERKSPKAVLEVTAVPFSLKTRESGEDDEEAAKENDGCCCWEKEAKSVEEKTEVGDAAAPAPFIDKEIGDVLLAFVFMVEAGFFLAAAAAAAAALVSEDFKKFEK